MYQRILLKLSGEFFKGDENAIAIEKIERLADHVESFVKQGTKIAVVVGAGNIMRGRIVDPAKYSTVIPDHAGMLGAVINGLMLKMVLQQRGIVARVESSFQIDPVVEPHKPLEARRRFEDGEVIILGGTGLPYFSTDTAAVLFGLELGVDAVLKGTHIDGVYDDNPHTNPDANRYDTLDYDEALKKDLKVMDATAFAMAKQHALPIVVFQWSDESMKSLLEGVSVGTTIS
ncbi:MAG: uridine monophosphate kinase [Patescibacteria group bacterium]